MEPLHGSILARLRLLIDIREPIERISVTSVSLA